MCRYRFRIPYTTIYVLVIDIRIEVADILAEVADILAGVADIRICFQF